MDAQITGAAPQMLFLIGWGLNYKYPYYILPAQQSFCQSQRGKITNNFIYKLQQTLS